MSIIIKGVEMPKNCDECPCIAWRYDDDSPACCVLEKDISDYTKRLADCPLVEIKTPHGRLIDADALILALMDRGVDDIQTDDLHEISQTVWNAPTVVESEE